MRRTRFQIAAITALTLTLPLSRAVAQSAETTGSTATFTDQSTFTAPAIAATRFEPADWLPVGAREEHNASRLTLVRGAPLVVGAVGVLFRTRALLFDGESVRAALTDEPGNVWEGTPRDPRATPYTVDAEDDEPIIDVRPTPAVDHTTTLQAAATTAPEPSTLVLCIAGLSGLGLAEVVRRHARRHHAAMVSRTRRRR